MSDPNTNSPQSEVDVERQITALITHLLASARAQRAPACQPLSADTTLRDSLRTRMRQELVRLLNLRPRTRPRARTRSESEQQSLIALHKCACAAKIS